MSVLMLQPLPLSIIYTSVTEWTATTLSTIMQFRRVSWNALSNLSLQDYLYIPVVLGVSLSFGGQQPTLNRKTIREIQNQKMIWLNLCSPYTIQHVSKCYNLFLWIISIPIGLWMIFLGITPCKSECNLWNPKHNMTVSDTLSFFEIQNMIWLGLSA